MSEDLFKNYGMLVPKYAIHHIDECILYNATADEFLKFSKWVKENLTQLSTNEQMVDAWISRPSDLESRKVLDINKWFEKWKQPPQKGFTMTTHVYPTKKQIRLAEDTIDREDILALCEWLQQSPTPKLTKGDLTLEYERRYAAKCNRKYAVFVNSGSSANLLAIYSLIATNRLKNNKIIVPALSWITTISPVIQFGLDPNQMVC